MTHPFHQWHLDAIQAHRAQVEADLWAKQLELQPDSVHVTRGEALGWMYEDNPDAHQISMECWDQSNQEEHGRRIADRLAYYEKCVLEERYRMARAVATAMCHDVGIFYMSGLMPNGHYRDKGFRFGLEPGQVLSAFTHG